LTPDQIFEGFQQHPLFCKESLIVEAEDKRLVPMILGPGQLRLREGIAKQRKRGLPVRIIYLKSRRIQATTGTAAEFFHETAFRAGVHTVVLAHDAPSSENIFRIYERFHNQYKPFGGIIKLPPSRPLSDRIYYEYGDEDESSFIQVHTAGNTNFGRSFRITNLHFSEYPYYADSAATRASAMSAVSKTADTSVVIEGTAKTIGDDFHHIWQDAVDPAGESEWLGLFLGWWEHPGNRMDLTMPLEQFANSVTREERDLMGRFNLNYEQVNWRRYVIRNDFRGDMQSFTREHPATPEEAFTAASRNRFSIPHIQRMPIQRQALVGELQVDKLGEGEERIIFLPGDTGALRIYRMPERGRCYALGADPSGGADVNKGKGQADPDWAVGELFDRGTGEQCAVLRLRCMPGHFGRQIDRLARFYNLAQIALERTGAGIGSLEALMNCNYPTALIYHRPVANDQDPAERSDKIGWQTDEVSRQQLVSLLDDAIRAPSIYIHDPTTIQELLWFVINAVGRPEAQKGTHDDCVIGTALACVVMARMPLPIKADARAAPRIGKYGEPVEVESRGRTIRPR
jgi:hypothetical protein